MEKLKKILIVSSYYGIEGGGSGIIVKRMSEELVKKKFDVVVVSIHKSRMQEIKIINGVKIIKLSPKNIYPLTDKDKQPTWKKIIFQIIDIYNPTTYFLLRKILFYENPDIIHIHKMRGFSGSVWHVTTKFFYGKVLQTCHDFESISPDGLLRGKIGKLAKTKSWPISIYQNIRSCLTRNITHLTCPSEFTLNQISKLGVFNNSNKSVIGNSHSFQEKILNEIHREVNEISTDPSTVNFLFLGRLEEEKGIKQLCRVFTSLSKRHKNITLSIGGWGNLKDELLQKYFEDPQINFLGTINGKHKRTQLLKSNFLVIPSLVEETFGIVVVEAYSYGLPVIGNNIGGLPEIIKEGETGWLAIPNNLDSLIEKMEIAINSRNNLNKMVSNCLAYSKEYTIDNITAKYIHLYNSMIMEKKV